MRPIQKQCAGHVFDNGITVHQTYPKYQDSYSALLENGDTFCSYCEVFCQDLHVEHIISKDQDSSKEHCWDNFLLSCARCNGKDNKGDKSIDINTIYFPHLNNTLYALQYKEGGLIEANTALLPTQRAKAEALIDVLGLDKHPDNAKYPKGFPNRDRRWEFRREAWESAESKLKDYEEGLISANNIAEYVRQRGFFSIWFNMFNRHIEVKKALVDAFRGTDPNSFNENYEPIPRNPHCATDPV